MVLNGRVGIESRDNCVISILSARALPVPRAHFERPIFSKQEVPWITPNVVVKR